MAAVFPDIRHINPSRESITERTVVVDDVTNALIEWNKAVARFEEEQDSRFGMLANRRADELIDLIQLYKRRVNDIRKEINEEIRRQRRNKTL